MKSRLSVVGTLLASVLAIGALTAASAQAEVEFTAAQYPATYEGKSTADAVLKIGTKIAVCKQEHFKASTAVKSKFETQKTSYTECTVNNLPATVIMNGCDWEYYPAKKKGTLKCPPGKTMVLDWYSSQQAHKEDKVMCAAKFSEQELSTIEYEDMSGSTEDIELKTNMTGMNYEMEGSILLCGEGGTEATLTSETTVTATNEAEEPIAYMIG